MYMAYIELSGKRGKGQRTLVDDSTFKQYGHLTWYLSDTGYAVRKTTEGTIRLHRLVANTPEGMFTDHKNHNRLDNRASNLRVVTQAENMANYKGAKGYAWDKSRNQWLVRYKGKFYGRYATEDEAKRVYQLACSGVQYNKSRRKLYMLPEHISKQFGKYVVSIQKDKKRFRKVAIPTLEEAISIRDKHLEKRG